MGNKEQEIANTKSYFKSRHIPLNDEWVESCIEWCKEEECEGPYTEDELISAVYKQWLVFDLREVDIPQLPQNVQSSRKLRLHKHLALQMMSIMDISKPKLQQLNKIKNSYALTRGFDDDNANETNYGQGPTRRTLQMILTDGVQEIKAMEYKPMDCLNLNLPPGVKILIKPPIMIRRGMIILSPQSITILGGEVEEIAVSHSAENVLAQSLNLPINPNPGNVNDSTLMENRENQIQTNNINPSGVNINILNINKNNDNNTVLLKQKEKRNEDVEMLDAKCDTLNKKTNIKETNSTHQKNNYINEEEEEEMRISQEVEMLLEAERDLLNEQQEKTKNVPKNSTPELLNSDLIDLNDEFFSSWKETVLSQEEEEEKDKIYLLSEVKKKIASKRLGKYTTFAKFKSVKQKLTVSETGWDLQICIASEDEELVVRVHDKVVSGMCGYSSDEMLVMKRKIQEKDVVASANVMGALNELRLKLQSLNSLMEVEYKAENEVPCLINLL